MKLKYYQTKSNSYFSFPMKLARLLGLSTGRELEYEVKNNKVIIYLKK